MFGKKTEQPTTRLRELSGSDYTIPKGQPDIRGWDVRDAQGRKFGTVHDLIFDIRAGKVRYMVLNVLDTPELDLDKRSVLVPIGLAELDSSDNDVFLPSINPFQLRALPRYDRSKLGARAERDIRTVFGWQAFNGQQQGQLNTAPQEDVDEQFYNHDHFNEQNMLRRRQGLLGNQHTEHRNDDRHLQQNEPVRRRETELNAASSTVEDEAYRRGFEDGQRHRAETDEEYLRRTGRERRNG